MIPEIRVSTEMLRRYAEVNRERDPQAMLDATGRVLQGDLTLVKLMPRGVGKEVTVFFFQSKHSVGDPRLDHDCYSRGLVLADPYSLGAVNEVEPGFAYHYPSVTAWKDEFGRWCSIAFNNWNGQQSVYLTRPHLSIPRRRWIAGLLIP